jgi:hypothetical protein
MARDSQKDRTRKDEMRVNRNRKRRTQAETDRCDTCGDEVYANMLTPVVRGGRVVQVCGFCL